MTDFWFIDYNNIRTVDWAGFNSDQTVLFDELEEGIISGLIHTDFGNTLVF